MGMRRLRFDVDLIFLEYIIGIICDMVHIMVLWHSTKISHRSWSPLMDNSTSLDLNAGV